MQVLYVAAESPTTPFQSQLRRRDNVTVNAVDNIADALELAKGRSSVDCLTLETTEAVNPILANLRAESELPVVVVGCEGDTQTAYTVGQYENTLFVPEDIPTATGDAPWPAVKRLVDQWQKQQMVESKVQAIQIATDGIGILGEDGSYVYVNDSYADMYGYDPDDLVGLHWSSLYPDDEVRRFETDILERVEQEGEWSGTATGWRDNGERFRQKLSLTMLEDGGHVCILRDVTDQATLKEELRVKNRAMHETDIGILITDPDKSDNPIIYANEGFRRLTGYPVWKALGQNCRFLQGPETDEETVAELRRAIDNEESVAVEILNYRRDGTTFWNHLQVTPVYDGDSVTNFIGFLRDITEQKDRERRLERQEQTLQAAGDPIYALDAEGRLIGVNDRLLELTGHDRDDILGRFIRAFMDDSEVEQIGDTIRALYKDPDRTRGTFKTVIRPADGSRRICEVKVALLEQNGEFCGTVGVIRDITAQKQREQRLEVLDRILRHNLRNKMSIVRGHLDRCLEHIDDEAAADSLCTAKSEANQLLCLGNKARRFHRLLDEEDRRGDDVDMAEFIATVVEGVDEMGKTETDVEAGLTMRTDAPLLRAALGELVENAIEHNDCDRPYVRLSAMSVEVDDEVELTVIDNAPEIPISEQTVVLHGDEEPLHHGEGLGLWFVKWAVMLLGGDLTFERLADGNAVTLTLPKHHDPRRRQLLPESDD